MELSFSRLKLLKSLIFISSVFVSFFIVFSLFSSVFTPKAYATCMVCDGGHYRPAGDSKDCDGRGACNHCGWEGGCNAPDEWGNSSNPNSYCGGTGDKFADKGICCDDNAQAADSPTKTCQTGSQTCERYNNYPCTKDEQCKFDDKGKPLPHCERFYCSLPQLYQNYGVTGICLPDVVAPPCMDRLLNMEWDPQIPKIGEITLKLSGGQGSTWVQDSWSPDSAITCPITPGGGFWNNIKCQIKETGTIYWKHKWKNCAPNDTNNCTQECEKTAPINAFPSGLAPTSIQPCNKDNVTGKCDTALGTFDVTDPKKFVARIFTWVLAIGGISALLLLIYSGYLLMVSGGDKQKIQEARERITAAIMGLLFIILSISIFEFIGVDVLGLPGFRR